MSIIIDKHTKVITQGITGKTGAFHTRMCRDYANGRECFVAGVNPNKAGANFEGIPIFGTVKEAKARTGANVSVVYVPPPFAAAAIDEAVDAELDVVICITEGVPRTRATATIPFSRAIICSGNGRRPKQSSTTSCSHATSSWNAKSVTAKPQSRRFSTRVTR